MTSVFEDIFSRFLLKVTDYNFVRLDEDTVNEMMIGWLKATLSKPYVRRIFSSLTISEDFEEIEFELKNPVDEQSDADYVEELVATGMVVEWVTPQVNSVINTQQMLSGKEVKFYSQSQHLAELKGLLSDSNQALRKMIRDHGYFVNSYIGGD